MKKQFAAVFSVLALSLIMTSTAPAFEPHPEIRAALADLRSAKAHLQEGAHDFHGHRVAALKHVDEAIAEAETCLHE